MRFLALTPAVVAIALSIGSTLPLVVAIVNTAFSAFAINTILNLGTQRETGDMIEAFDTYKNVAVAVLTITWIAAIVLIVVAVA
jgi:hypothetical protein